MRSRNVKHREKGSSGGKDGGKTLNNERDFLRRNHCSSVLKTFENDN